MSIAIESERDTGEAAAASPPPDAKAQAKAQAAALAELLAPVRTRTRVAKGLQLLGSAATVVPFIGIVELGRTLLADGPVDRSHVWAVVWLVLAGLGARAFFSGLALAITHFADVDLQAILRRRIVEKLGRLPLGWFTRTSSGEVRKAAQNDVHEVHYLVAHAEVETTAAVATPLFALAYCFVLDWRLGLLAIATLPFYAAAYAWMVRDMTERMAAMNEGMAKISSTIVEFVSGVAVVKTFGEVGKSHKQFVEAADEFNDGFAGYVVPLLRLEAVASIMLSAPLILLINLAGGTWFARNGWVEPIEVVGSTLIAMILPTALLTVSMAMHNRQQAAAAAGRLLDLLALDDLGVSSNPVVPEDNTVVFDGVVFRYPGRAGEAAVRALDGVDLTLRPGTMTAIVGRSGSGKSTLAALLHRFHDPDEGTVRIGGADVREIDPAALYRTVGFVLQDVSLLGISVRDNIILGRPDATDAQVEAAARAAHITTGYSGYPTDMTPSSARSSCSTTDRSSNPARTTHFSHAKGCTRGCGGVIWRVPPDSTSRSRAVSASAITPRRRGDDSRILHHPGRAPSPPGRLPHLGRHLRCRTRFGDVGAGSRGPSTAAGRLRACHRLAVGTGRTGGDLLHRVLRAVDEGHAQRARRDGSHAPSSRRSPADSAPGLVHPAPDG